MTIKSTYRDIEDHYETLENQLLIATSRLPNPHFKQSVIYVCKATDKGVMGIVINKPSQHNLSDLLRSQNISFQKETLDDQPILAGGPISKDQGFIVHSNAILSKDTLLSLDAENVDVTTSRDMLQVIADGEGPRNIIVSLGCASWGIQQLVDELTIQNYWLIAPASNHIIFRTPYPVIWQMAAASIGVDFTYLSNEIGRA